MPRDDDDFGLLSHLDELMDDLHDNVPKALKEFDVDGIHDARVATRRLKAALGLLKPVLSDDHLQAFDKVLKKVRRRLGPLRDLDVMIEHLGKLESHPTHGTAATWLKVHLEQRRQAEREESKAKVGSADVLAKLGAWWHVREEVIDSREAVDVLLAESLHLQLDEFAERAGGIVKQTSGPVEPADRQDPHELRIAGKLLRYTLELAQSEGHTLPPAIMRQFKQMQELLGNWHDDVVLMQCAMKTSLDASLSYHDLEMQGRLLDLDRFFLRRATKELSHFASLWKKRGEPVSRTIRERFPLTKPVLVSGLKMDPDPSDSSDMPVLAEMPPDVASTA
jgi:CHAD domain-containing protein